MHCSMLAVLFCIITSTQAHMHLVSPPPLNASNNPHTTGPPIPSSELDYPYNCCGRINTLPCKSSLSLLGTRAGAPVASWPAGSNQTFTLAGTPPLGGNHWGGSCQVGFSVDGGKTFRVATSYLGNCPHRNGGVKESGQTFEFVVPMDMPTGDAVFAWTWVNREQEFNMNCAAVTITSSDGSIGSDSSPSMSAVSLTETTTTTSTQSSARPSLNAESNDILVEGCTCSCDSQPHASSKLTEPSKRSSASVYHNCTCTCKEPSSPDMLLRRHRHSMSRHGAQEQRQSLQHRDTTPWPDRPEMFLNFQPKVGCMTPHTTAELRYPHTGPDVVMGDGVYSLELPSGKCTTGIMQGPSM